MCQYLALTPLSLYPQAKRRPLHARQESAWTAWIFKGKQLAGVQLDRCRQIATFVCMRTTLNIRDELLAEAGKLAGTSEKTALVRMGLEALIEREAARRLARMGGAMPRLKLAPRRLATTARQ